MIYMEPTEFERKMLDVIYNTMTGNFAKGQDAYLDAIRKIMPPTCTATERMFLDEIMEKGKYNPGYDAIEIGEGTVVYNKDFQWAMVKELVNE